MYKWFLTAAAVCLLGVSAVAVAEDSYYLELPTKGVTSSRKITVDVPGENPVEDGVNPLTGESWYGNYYPILVNIDAHPEALPHWGVASADISYEMPVQADGSTRSAMLFMGTIPAYAGPVRSGRVPMGSLREIWGGAWVFYGWQNWANGNNTVVDVDDWALSVHSDARQKGRWVFPFVEGPSAITAICSPRERRRACRAAQRSDQHERRRLPVHQRIDQAPVQVHRDRP
ncbi:MAG: DUF3048 domain-containing protein [Christensenellales bacterium]